MSLISASLLIIIRMYASFHSYKLGLSFPNETLIEAFSIAIWSKNKIAVGIALILGVANVSAIIQGKFLLPPVDCRESHTNVIFNRRCTGEQSISTMLDHVGLFVCSFARRGFPCGILVSYLTPRSSSLPSPLRSSLT